jgi:ribosomal protein S18 acetylase RimI-like enzyme
VNWVIRAVAPSDEAFLWEMLYQAIHVPPGAETSSRDVLLQPEIRRYMDNWGQPDDLGFVAVNPASSNLAGAAWLRLLTGAKKGYGYVDDATPELTVAVLPEFRGRGVGTRLLNHLLETAQNRYPSVSLSVSPGNPALRLYQRLGFETIGMCGASQVMKRESVR